MVHYLRFITGLALLCGLVLGTHQAQASHLLGGDLTYTSLGGNNYRVKFRLYRDCTGISTGAYILEARNGACNTAANITAVMAQQGAATYNNPFCGAVSAGPCQGPVGQPNYDIYTFQADVVLPPGNWTLSTNQSTRPTLANIAGGDLYVQASLDNRNSPTGAAVINSSPQFDPQDIPMQYVCWKQPTTITYSATEPDGDSLVYTLAPPLDACNTPVTYLPNPGAQGGLVVLSNNPFCVLQMPGSMGNFSPAFPLPVTLDTAGVCPLKTGVPRFNFNQRARTISFTPSTYYPNTPAAQGRNKYQIAMQLTEYRRIGGVMRVVGQVQREGTLIVTDCGNNTVPTGVVVTPQTSGSGTQSINTVDTTQINVFACSYSRVRLSFTDPDNLRVPSAHQLLSVSLPSDINSNLLAAGDIGTFALTGNNTENPVGTFHFQPSPSAVGHTIRINMRIEDDACPIKGIQTRVVVIRILRGNFAFILAPTGGVMPTVNPGASLSLLGFVARPDSVRNFATNNTVPQAYSYQWTIVGGGNGLPAVTNTANISVTPTVNTRYRLRVMPLLGFAQGVCGDTSSILVLAAPLPLLTPTITRTGTTLTSSPPTAGTATGYQWYLNGVLIPGATGPSITATTAGIYTVQTTTTIGGRTYASPLSAPFSILLAAQRTQPGTSLSVVPNPTPDGRFSVVLTGYHQPVTITVLDALGRTVSRTFLPSPAPQGTTQPMDLTTLGAGLYVLQVRTATSLETRRIVRE